MLWLMAILCKRALLQQCPRCGRGKLYRRGFTMYDRCSYCAWHFEREEGYWTGAMAVNLIISEFIIAAVVIPLAALQTPLVPLIAVGVPCSVLLPFLFYRHSKAFWMAIDFFLNPVSIW